MPFVGPLKGRERRIPRSRDAQGEECRMPFIGPLKGRECRIPRSGDTQGEECRMSFVGPLKGACPSLCPQKACDILF